MSAIYRSSGGLGSLGWFAGFLLLLGGVWFAADWGAVGPRGNRDAGPELERAERLVASGDTKGAEALYSAAIGLDPECGAAFSGRAGCRLRQRDFGGALEDLKRAETLGLRPEDLALLRGRARVGLGEYRVALPDLAIAAERHQDRAEALLLRGAVLKDQGDLGGAVDDLSELIRLNPLQPLAYLMRAEAYLLGARFSEALADYERVSGGLLAVGGGLFGRGLALLGVGRAAEALDDFERARGAGVDSRATWEGKALALEILGRHEDAAVAWAQTGGSRESLTVSAGDGPRLGAAEISVLMKRSRSVWRGSSGEVNLGGQGEGYPAR